LLWNGPNPIRWLLSFYAYYIRWSTLSRHSPTRIVCLQTVTTVRVPFRIHQIFQNNTTNNNTILKHTTQDLNLLTSTATRTRLWPHISATAMTALMCFNIVALLGVPHGRPILPSIRRTRYCYCAQHNIFMPLPGIWGLVFSQ